jgi:hypothetical protein
MRYPRLAGCLVCAVAWLLVPAYAKDPLPVSPLQIMEPSSTALPFSWDQLQAGRATVSIWNPSAQQEGSIQVTDFNQAGQPAAFEVIAILPGNDSDRIKLSEFTITRFALKLKSTPTVSPSPGVYSGFVVVRDVANATLPLTKQITIKVTSPQPAVSKFTTVAWRLVPFTRLWCAQAHVPLKKSDFIPSSSDYPIPIGFVQKDTSGIASVFWDKTESPSSRTSLRARLSIPDLPYAGKYEGEVLFNKEENRSGAISLGVIAKDIAIWPVLVIAVGIYTAFLTKRYLSVLRACWMLRKQEASLGDLFRDAQRRFVEATRGTPSAAYSIAADVAQQRNAILALLSSVDKNRWTSDLTGNADYSKAVSSLQALQGEIVSWSQFGTELSSLAQRVSTLSTGIDHKVVIPATLTSREPAILAQAGNLLVGDVVQGAAIDTLRKAVADATAFSQAWIGVNDRAKVITAEFVGLRGSDGLSDAQKTILDTVHDQLVSAWTHLWDAQSSADLGSILATGGDLDSAEVSLMKVESAREQRMVPSSAALDFLQLQAPQTVAAKSSAAVVDITHLPANDNRRYDLLAKAITLGDRGTAVLAFLIALLTGLNSYYFNKPFGTLQDYSTLFLWAVGTKASLDILTSVLDKLSTSIKPTLPV